jgi:heat shock protein HslJ
MGRRAFGLALLACLVVSITAVAAPPRRESRRRPARQPPAADVIGSEWVLEELGGRDVVGGVQVTLSFPEAGKVTGNGGCNRYFGAARISGDRIEVQHIGSTRMACPPAVMDQEHLLFDALQKARRLEVDEGVLLIHSTAVDEPLKFRRVVDQGASPGERQQASLSGVVTYRQRIALPPYSELHVRLVDASRADGRVQVLAEQTVAPAGQVPIRFRLTFDPSRVDTSREYRLQARIEGGGTLLFINTRPHPVRLDGSLPETEIVLDPVWRAR